MSTVCYVSLSQIVANPFDFLTGLTFTPFRIEFPDLNIEEVLRSFTDEEVMRKAYQKSISSDLNDSGFKVLQLRPGSKDAICTTSNPIVSFNNLATKQMHLPLPKCPFQQRIILHIPIGDSLSISFDSATTLTGYVDELRKQIASTLANSYQIPSPNA